MNEIDLELLKKVVRQIMKDDHGKDYTAIEELFQFLDYPEERLKSFIGSVK